MRKKDESRVGVNRFSTGGCERARGEVKALRQDVRSEARNEATSRRWLAM